MKAIASYTIQKIIVFLFFFTLGVTYSQGKKTTDKTIFGKTAKSESTNPKTGQIRCATAEYEKFLLKKNPKRMTEAQFEAWLKPLVSKYKSTRSNSKIAGTVITIPVVVHVIHSGQAIGTAPNINDAQVQSQITVLNQDYRKMAGTPGGSSTNPVAADVEIEFVLALQDPNGNPTNGIDRVNFCSPSWSDEEIEATVKPSTIWDPTQYLNMWSVQFSNNTLLGYAQPPDASGLPGLSASGGNANTDGVVSSYDVFGSKTYDTNNNFLLDGTYNKGRTMTHEVGHWVGLRHIWGDGGSRSQNTKNCNASDYCDDTPQAGWENYDCVTSDSCPLSPGNDMIENYMDYTTDACMNIFTNDQKARTAIIMANAARRSSLKNSTKGNAIPLFTNDAEVKIEGGLCIDNYGCESQAPTNKQVTIYNRGTSTLTAVTLNYSINGGSNQTQSWTGSLAQNESAVITLLNTNLYGVLNVNITTTNGSIDQRSSNDTATATFLTPAIPTNYNFNDFTFTLQQDFWGSETTWELKNGSGAIVHSGGPYTDSATLPALLTENWILTNNECYTFTIKDTSGDGICCGIGGNGYYNLKSTTGATTVISGTEFGYSDNISFTVNTTLGTNELETFETFYLYPNPTNNILNIYIPSKSALPNNYSISNALGQTIIQKNIINKADLTINTSILSNGVYFITIGKGDQKKTLKFIKE